ncbi:hypothetical protein B296_00053849 [Ensete ventricosum]|uniref:Uncharacterized protein n=1 Tax=Ensete ventricosum TaxID=4639 RepID=A0A426X2F9_ENSVE|nr:hypothetical protein B296_00053849 [Ensete ventricosum]
MVLGVFGTERRGVVASAVNVDVDNGVWRAESRPSGLCGEPVPARLGYLCGYKGSIWSGKAAGGFEWKLKSSRALSVSLCFYKDEKNGRRRMRGDRGSTAEEVVPWWEKEVAAVAGYDEDGWKCRKQHAQPLYGVCPACLRDRLLRLCPDCANVRPCGCFPSYSSSSSSSSSLSSADLARSGGVGGGGEERGGVGIGVVGPVSRLMEREPAFRRSRSVGLQLLRTRSVASTASEVGNVAQPSPPSGGSKGWATFWPFSWALGGRASAETAREKLYRSTSVALGRSPDASGGRKVGRGKGSRRWHFPSPMKVFRRHKSTTRAVQERSPLWRG